MKTLLTAAVLIGFQAALFAQAEYPNLNFHKYVWQNVPPEVLDYLNNTVPVAAEVARERQIPVDFLICVAGLETGWGLSELATQANNHFGLKNHEHNPGPSYCVWHSDFIPGQGMVSRYECFKKYDDLRTCFSEFADHLENYSCYLEVKDLSNSTFRDWAQVLQTCGYATDPDYAGKLDRIREKYYLAMLIPE